MAYMDEIPRGEGIDRFEGVSYTNTGTPHSVYFCGGEAGDTIFRALPEIQNGVEIPFRVGEGNFNFSYFMKGRRYIRSAGVNSKFSCFTEVAGQPREYRGPIDRFADEIFKVTEGVKKGRTPASAIPQEWLQWVTRGMQAPYGALSRVSLGGLMQGLLFRNGKTTFQNAVTKQPEPKAPVLLIIPKSAREKIEKLGNTEVQGYQGPRDAWEQRYALGEALKLSSGRLFQFIFQSGVDAAAAGVGSLSSYIVNMLPQMWPVALEDATQMFLPWDKLVRLHTEKEQMEMLIKHFPPESIDFVFGHTELAALLPDTVRGRWHNRASYAPPVAPAPAGYGQPQQYAPAPGGWTPGQAPPQYAGWAPPPAAPAAPAWGPPPAAPAYPPAAPPAHPYPAAPVPPPAPPMPTGFALPSAPAVAGGFLPPQAGHAPASGGVPQFGPPAAAPAAPTQIPGFQLPASPDAPAADDEAPWVTGQTSPSVAGSFPATPVSTPPPAAPGGMQLPPQAGPGAPFPPAPGTADRVAAAKAKLDAAQAKAREALPPQ